MKAPTLPLFVYGSLLTGTSHRRLDRLMKACLAHSRPAVIQALLYDLGDYPGAVPSTLKADRVHGRLITIPNPTLWRLLDQYEDFNPGRSHASEFVRTPYMAQRLNTRRPVRCWVYFYNGDVSGKSYIPGGDYSRSRV